MSKTPQPSSVPGIMAHHRRSREEALLLQGRGELAAALLPLALTVARMAARNVAREAAGAKIALSIGRNGSGLLPCMSAVRRLRATTVTMLGVDGDDASSQAVLLRQLLRRLEGGEFDGILAWLDGTPAG